MLIEDFNRLTIFQGMSSPQQELLSGLFIPYECCDENVIFEQGDLAEFLYIVVEGEVIVSFKPDDGPAIIVARIQTGGVVGWSAALGSRMYTSGAYSNGDTRLLRIRGTDLRKLCEQYPDTGVILLDRLAAVIAQRLTSTHDQVLALLELGLRSDVNEAGG
jgi:CRP/FNR family transcriptional regulator, cyclic AMP receptor protein